MILTMSAPMKQRRALSQEFELVLEYPMLGEVTQQQT